jgi:hypothetical protein
MRRSHAVRLIFVAMILEMRAICLAVQEEPNTPALKAPEARKTRTELLNELELRKAQVTLEHARQAYDRDHRELGNSQALFQRHIISKQELDRAISADAQSFQDLRQAEIALEQTKLGFLANATHITILEAKKYYDKEGRRMLDLVLKNTSNLRQAESSLILVDPNGQTGVTWQSADQIRALLNIENIIVSIVGDAASIGKPYEAIIPLLPYQEQHKVTFELLTDVEQAGVRLQYLAQTVTDIVYLEKESSQTLPTVVAPQFALEGQLGSEVSYELNLEMLVTSAQTFSMALTNMPPQITCFFVEGGARITSVRFSEEVSKHNLTLRASIPQSLDTSMIDQRIDFQAWIVKPERLDKIYVLKRRHEPQPIPEEDLEAIDAARLDLTLIPKGTGRLEIQINNLYREIEPETDVNIKATVHNDGTLTLFDIVPAVSPPLDWSVAVEPTLIEKLAPNDKVEVKIHLTPDPGAGVGEYEARIEARGQSGSEVVEALEKRFKVRIKTATNTKTILVLVGTLVFLIVAMVAFGVRLSRR